MTNDQHCDFIETQADEIIGFFGDNVDTLRSVVGAKIRALRKSSSMSQADLAEQIGCEAPLIGRYERGINLPGIEQLIRIATVFKVAPGELLPGGQDVLRTRLISLRQELSEKINQVDSPESLEEIIRLTDKFIAYNHPGKKI
ncbi:helix-turn-helix domain-containing protein [Pseudomonas syringae]|uniref:helix-turn-helix domain-containing protein n=1 Tax=Pseudomonas syringae TaxID=317 RepID=UPI0009B5281B|nr:helix-turn-helix transcriptional regulator [Pseudomonas syringae]MCK0550828.1 helix-turn-helix domain-containing protein [Pseudomonas syringae pv. aptata]QVK35003.1 helix-turn-helix transcriptional regulator [Pseudomonas syringae]